MEEFEEMYRLLREVRVPQSCEEQWHAARVALVNLKLTVDAAYRSGEPAFLVLG